MAVIQVSHLNKSFSIHQKEPGLLGSIRSFVARKHTQVTAVKDISFSVEQGELIGFIGPNGAGKTTTLKCLSGLLYPTSGEIAILGYTPYERHSQFLKQISLVMGQKSMLWWDLPAYETFILNKEIYEVPEKLFKDTVEELSELLEIKAIFNVQVRKLSLGQRMKCELVAALVHQPKILFLDEPTIGLDVIMQKKLRDFIKAYNRRTQATILLTSHYMNDVRELCKRVIIIDHGSLIFDGQLDTIVKQYAPNKILTIIFNQTVQQKDIEVFGKITEYSPLKVVISIPQEKLQIHAAEILKKLPVEDITIEEMNIEDIVRDIFSRRQV